jgi:Protein of unknown function (DUF3435)
MGEQGPHIFLLGLLFADKAFKAPNLTSPEQLNMLDIGRGRNQLPLGEGPARRAAPALRTLTMAEDHR